MKLLPALIWILFLLISGRTSGQDFLPEGARFDALAGSSTALSGCWSVSGNQAGLCSVARAEFAGTFQNRFLVNELSAGSVLFALPIQSSVFAVSYFQFGELLFRQEQFGFAYARKISPKIRFGVQFSYFRIYLSEENRSTGTSGIELGIQYVFSKQLLFGAHVKNPYRTEIKTFSGKSGFPTRINVGICYSPTNYFSLSSEFENEFGKPLIVKTGLEYVVFEQFFIRGGIYGKPVQISGGIGFRIKKLSLDLASSYHSFLGNSPSVSLQYQF